MCSQFRFFLKNIFNRNSAFANGLAAHGHNVTVISADRDKNPPNGVHYIQMEGLYTNGLYDEIVKNAFVPNEKNTFELIAGFTDYMTLTCKSNHQRSYIRCRYNIRIPINMREI